MLLVAITSLGTPNAQTECGNLVCPGQGLPAWKFWNESQVPAGSTGCQNLSGEDCYSVQLMSTVADVPLSEFKFEVLSESNATVPLGTSALVTVLDSSGSIVGAWNWTVSEWAVGGGWTVPVDENLSLVLDTGVENGQFATDWFWIFVASDSVGVTLQ